MRGVKPPPMSRKFITLEGGEGAGKTTQIKLLADALKAGGLDPIITREPGGSPAAEVIRSLLVEGAVDRWQPMTEALLNFAARLEHVQATIEPALAAGRWVLCDRFADSTVAYQGYGHDLGRAVIDELHRLVLGYFQPDLTVILDIPVAEGLARATNRERAEGSREDRYEHMDEGFHQRLRDGFLDIDAAQEPDKVQAEIRTVVGQRLKVAWA